MLYFKLGSWRELHKNTHTRPNGARVAVDRVLMKQEAGKSVMFSIICFHLSPAGPVSVQSGWPGFSAAATTAAEIL